MIHPNGSKCWRLKYRVAGTEKLLALCVYPEVTLALARMKRDEARTLHSMGVDPSAARQQEKQTKLIATASSFETIAREWLKHIEHKWSKNHSTYTLRRVEAYVFSKIGRIPIAEVSTPALLTRSAIHQTARNYRNRAQGYECLRTGVRNAIASGRCERNPVGDLKGAIKSRPTARHMNALPEKKLPDFLRKIDSYAADNGGELQTQYALQLLALTFVRTSELREATWEEFDLEKAVWRIPAERMKMKAQHMVPLARQAIDVIEKLKAINGGFPLVFPGANPKRPMSKNTALFALYRMGYRGRMTDHGFRAVASTSLNEMGIDADAIERQLAHAERNKVRAAYHRAEYLPERRKMMQTWADYLDSLKTTAQVIPIFKNA